MKKFKVTIWLLLDPSVGEAKEEINETVEAESEDEAYDKVTEETIDTNTRLKYLTVFDYEVKEL